MTKRKTPAAKTRAEPSEPETGAAPSPMMNGSDANLISIQNTCRRLGLWRATIKDLMLKGVLTYKIVDGRWFLDRDRVDAYAAVNGLPRPKTP